MKAIKFDDKNKDALVGAGAVAEAPKKEKDTIRPVGAIFSVGKAKKKAALKKK